MADLVEMLEHVFAPFLIAGGSADVYVFVALSLALLAVPFPRRDRWGARRTAPRA